MFKELTNFSYQRTTKEAIGFYLAYLGALMIISAVLGAILSVIVQNNVGFKVGVVVAIIASTGISFWIIKEKNLLNHFEMILLALLAGVLAVFLGGLGGLIPAAYLTTRATNTSRENSEL